MANIIIFALEPIDSRYTAQWYKCIPEQLTTKLKGTAHEVIQLSGVQTTSSVTSGAFLNFQDTNRWKSSQLMAFCDLLDAGKITSDDVILFTDAWNPVLLQVKYMRDLGGYNWHISSYWHAGAYDPTDILGYSMQKPWCWEAERAMFHASDSNWYATHFHKQMFLNNLQILEQYAHKALVSGQPHDLAVQALNQINLKAVSKSGVIWPHRYNADKQPEIAEDLTVSMNTDWCITQKLNLSKPEYYQKLSEASVMFSCSLHENLGISIMEGVMLDVIPVLPDRCSYSEMYMPDFLYPSTWTQDWASYQTHKAELVEFINHRLMYPKKYSRQMAKQKKILQQRYLTADVWFDHVIAKLPTNEI